MRATVVRTYPGRGRVLALSGGRAVTQSGRHAFALLKAGTTAPIAWIPGEEEKRLMSDDYGALFACDAGFAVAYSDLLVVWHDVSAAPQSLRIEPPMPRDWARRHRQPARAIAAAAGAAWVILTRETSSAWRDCDAWSRLVWDDGSARWGDIRTLRWEDMPHRPVGLGARSVPMVEAALLGPAGGLVLHHTSTQVGGVGNVRYGWAWSMLVAVDVPGHPTSFTDVQKGEGYAGSDGRTFLLKAGKGNKLFVYDTAGRLRGDIALTPRLLGGERQWGMSFDCHQRDLWLTTAKHVVQCALDDC